MKFRFIITIFVLLSVLTTEIWAGEIVEGVYIGWEKISDISPHDKSEVWYHEHELVVKNDKVIIKASPIAIKNGQLTYSASDGGFYTYEGKIHYKNNDPIIKIKIVNCDYCPVPVAGKWPEKVFNIIIENEVSFVFDSVRYVLKETK